MLRVEELRRRKGWNQAELARRVGVTQVSIWKFENGKANPNLETLVKLARALECSLDDLVDVEAVS